MATTGQGTGGARAHEGTAASVAAPAWLGRLNALRETSTLPQGLSEEEYADALAALVRLSEADRVALMPADSTIVALRAVRKLLNPGG